jgi:hypothetical protein
MEALMFDSIVDRADGSEGSSGVVPFMNQPAGLMFKAMLLSPALTVRSR